LKGEGCSINKVEAFNLFKLNADKGDAESQNALGIKESRNFGTSFLII
jgi:TPR repeat protein